MTFTDNGNTLDGGAFKVNSLGYTEDQSIQLTGGSHTLVGAYSGDASYKPSSSAGVVVTVTKATTAINNVSAPGTVSLGQSFTSHGNGHDAESWPRARRLKSRSHFPGGRKRIAGHSRIDPRKRQFPDHRDTGSQP